MKCLLNKIIQRDRSSELQGAPFQLFRKDGSVLCILSARFVGLAGIGVTSRERTWAPRQQHLPETREGNQRMGPSRASRTAPNLAVLDPGLFSIVHKTLMFYMLFQKIDLFFYIPLCWPSGLAVWIWAEVLWLEFKKGKKKWQPRRWDF